MGARRMTIQGKPSVLKHNIFFEVIKINKLDEPEKQAKE
jgi:hypothetical protein